MDDKAVSGELGLLLMKWISKEEAKKMFPSNENKVDDLECKNVTCRCKIRKKENENT